MTLGWELRDVNRVCIVVTDTGPGLTQEQSNLLFQPFECGGAEYGNISGIGIGLFVVKRLVEVFGGSVGVDSTPGVGSRFWIELERAELNFRD